MSSQTFDAETVDAIFSERDQLKVENAKLKEERDRMYKANVEKNGEILRLLKDNAKLQDLVRDAIYARDDADLASIVSTANRAGSGGGRMSDTEKLLLLVLTALVCPFAIPLVLDEREDS